MRFPSRMVAFMLAGIAFPMSAFAQNAELEACRNLGVTGLVKQWLNAGVTEDTVLAFCDDYSQLKRNVKSLELDSESTEHRSEINNNRIGDLEKTIRSLQTQVSNLAKDFKISKQSLPPNNSILLVDDPGGCPEHGWIDLGREEPAFFAGRVIIGAGKHSSEAQYRYRDYGGETKHILRLNEIPKHSHTVETYEGGFDVVGNGSKRRINFDDGWPWEGITKKLVTDTKGGGGAHNNMPPYVTTYFCKRVDE